MGNARVLSWPQKMACYSSAVYWIVESTSQFTIHLQKRYHFRDFQKIAQTLTKKIEFRMSLRQNFKKI